MAKKTKNSVEPSKPEPIQAKGKKGKKGKQGADSDATESVDARKQKQQQNRAKVTSTASWTGKLPATLLHEFCQKKRWNKVEYDMKKLRDGGMLAIAVLSYTDPKTKEVLQVRMNDPSYDKVKNKGLLESQETAVEARHMAATVALCRIAFNTNMHMMLPPNHKKLWYDLDDYRKALQKTDAKLCERLFNADPFAVILNDRKVQQQKEKERTAKENQAQKIKQVSIITSSTGIPASTSPKPSDKSSSGGNGKPVRLEKRATTKQHRSLVSFPRKAWEQATFVDLDESSRQMIESSIKYNVDWKGKLWKSSGTEDEASRALLEQRLMDLNFRKVHVVEAMKYTDPLSFLLFNLPEDDLPPFFQKRSEDSRTKVEIASLPLSTRKVIARLMECGVSKDEVMFALNETAMDEAEAAHILTKSFVPDVEDNIDVKINEVESIEMWDQEVCSICSIYEDVVNVIKPSSAVEILLNEKLQLKLRLYRSKFYPEQIPGIIISTFDESTKLPDYIKKQIVTKLLQYLKANGLLGDMCIFNIYEWLQENLSKIIDNPGPLLGDATLSQGALANFAGSAVRSQGKRMGRRSGKGDPLTMEELETMRKDYLQRVETPKFKEMLEARALLPAWKKQNTIVDLINKHNVVLITGETGSGKSTQVVQFLLDALQKENKATKIICTQPRRISAIGLAERVSDERCTNCGDEVGYIIRGVNKTKRTTRITFMTTGVLVRMLQGDRKFLDNSIVVIDEVHERSVDTDLLITLLKNLLPRVPNMKLVLMSATISSELFKDYFPNIGTCFIEGRTFPIKDFFLDDILEDLDFKIKRNDGNRFYEVDADDEFGAQNTDDAYLRPGPDCKYFRSGLINYDLLTQVVYHVDSELTIKSNDGSIIVFLPGVAEINKCCRILAENDTEKRFVILPLHSALSQEDQKKVFKRYPNHRKIVVSTNIAETSITIDDCVATIDSGRAKSVHYNPKDNTSRLVESFISRAEARQRRGRAGRVREGLSYKLFSKAVHEEMMAPMPVPEIRRISLESLYLSVKAMGIRDVTKFLLKGLEPPPLDALVKAEGHLIASGLLNEDDLVLTQLGSLISLMPVMDTKHGKLLIYSIIFGMVDTGVLAAAILSEGSLPFVAGMENRDKIKGVLSKYKVRGDLLAAVELVRQYIGISDQSDRRKFLKENYLSYNRISAILSARTQFYSVLEDVGFLPFGYEPSFSREKSQFNRNEGNIKLLEAVLTGAFYPNIARVQLPDQKFLATSSGAIEKDPDAKQIKFWIRNEEYSDKIHELQVSKTAEPTRAELDNLPLPATRAFIHPSSVFFSTKNVELDDMKTLDTLDGPVDKYNSKVPLLKIPFVVFSSSQVTSKLYLRDITPTTILGLLLFGGPIHYDISYSSHSPGIVVDNWLPIRTWCKNGVLIKELRTLLDLAIECELENPKYGKRGRLEDGAGIEQSKAILRLVESLIQNE